MLTTALIRKKSAFSVLIFKNKLAGEPVRIFYFVQIRSLGSVRIW